jgi:beta-lactamase superfamily II metal-dependent hydrolase
VVGVKHLTHCAEALLVGALFISCQDSALAADSAESLKARDAFAGLQLGSAPAPLLGSEVEAPEARKVSLAPGLNIYFINVFQGDAELIEFPNGKNLLIDAGSPPTPDSQYTTPIVSSFLKKHGVTKIDHMVMTHPHADHYGGMQWIFENLQVDNFYDTRIDNSEATGDDAVREQARKEPGCTVRYPVEGESLDMASGVEIKVLHSCPTASKSSDYGQNAGNALNDCSITLKISYKGASALFTGDIGSDVEARLVKTYGKALKSDILKVGHHGSAYSSSEAFLKAVKPKAAYIEVGKYNDYGHPTPSTLARLESLGIAIHRTDKEGTLEYAMGGALGSAVPVGQMFTTPEGGGAENLQAFQKLSFSPLLSQN